MVICYIHDAYNLDILSFLLKDKPKWMHQITGILSISISRQ